jgi:phosphoribosyl 1,2-cyclic phosphodiesterase
MLELDNALVFPFLDGRPIRIGGLEVVPFKKYHDAADAHSFIVKGAGFTVGVMTDLGYACDVVKHYFSLCDAVFLEANYDTDMLMNGKYPPALKRRISGGNGHLSNVQALELFLHHRSAHLQLLILSHLSKNNNRPEIVSDVFQPHAGKVAITIAGRNSETAVFSLLEKKFFPYEKPLFEKTTYPAKAGSTRHKTTRKKDNVLQLRLF